MVQPASHKSFRGCSSGYFGPACSGSLGADLVALNIAVLSRLELTSFARQNRLASKFDWLLEGRIGT